MMKNWPKWLVQIGILTAIVVVMTGIIPSEEAPDPEAYCPVGGLQAITTYVVNGSLPCSMSTLQIMMGLGLALAVMLFSKLFCGYVCPVGTVEDLLYKLRNRLHIKQIKVKNGSAIDKVLRLIKYVLLFWIFYTTATESELFCKNLDPYYAVATGFKGEITLWMSITSITLVVLGGFLIDRFWCRYICPLGAASNTLKFWGWVIALFALGYAAVFAGDKFGFAVPWWLLLGGFCLLGYLLEIFHSQPKVQIINVIKDQEKCNGCGLCTRACPYHINVAAVENGKVQHVDCTLCGECTAVCTHNALHIGAGQKCNGGFWKFVPIILTVLVFIAGIWFSKTVELPTINEKWGIESVDAEGKKIQLIDESKLETTTIEGLRSVKCYGSSMSFKAKLEKVQGIYGVKTYVSTHKAEILYDPAKITPEQIQKEIYVPSKFRIWTPDHTKLQELKCVTIRTEGMFDKMDINYLGLQMRKTGKAVFGLESEFECPLIVRVYMSPSENLDEEWFREIVEMKELEMPVHGGGTKLTPVDFEFVRMEEGYTTISVSDFVHKMFNPFKAEFKQRVEKHAQDKQYIYEVTDRNYEKPIILRNMPYLSNHLSKHEGIIGIYLNLNDELMPAIQIRYAAPMTKEKLWELMTMETWTITYKADDVRQEHAKLSFKKEGIEYPYNPETNE